MHTLPRRTRRLAALTLAVFAAGCATPRGGERIRSASAVVGKRWQWEGTRTPTETVRPPLPAQYMLELADSGRAVMRFDCNRGGGAYQISDGSLTFGPLMSTRMACAPGSLADRYAQDLAAVRSFYVEGSELYLEIPGGGTMRFSAAR